VAAQVENKNKDKEENVMSLGRIASLGFVAILVLAQAANADEPSLKGSGEIVVTAGGGTWEAALRKAFFDPFQQETGIKVVVVPDDRAKLLASVERGKPEADITNLSASSLSTWLRHKAFEKIDYKYFDQETLSGMPDAVKDEYGVGSSFYSIMMAFSESEYPSTKPRPNSWAEFWDTKKFPGPRGLAGCGDRLVSGGTLEYATLASGVPMDKLYPMDIDKAFKKLAELKSSVGRWWQAGGESPQGLIDGELSMATAFNGRLYNAFKQKAPIGSTWNQSLIEYDYWVVPKGSPNYDNALKFLAFISKAKPQADYAIEFAGGPINSNAYKYIPDDLAKWLPGSPQNVKTQVYQNYHWWNEVRDDGKTNLEVALDRCVAELSH
jgi:putative spermidine/putrescine transport system substrate-binding protein